MKGTYGIVRCVFFPKHALNGYHNHQYHSLCIFPTSGEDE